MKIKLLLLKVLPAIIAICLAQSAFTEEYFPSDVESTCIISSTDFAEWFSDGEVTENGAVNAADSLNFDSSTSCNFDKWAWQMFLWAMSETESGWVFQSDGFYDVDNNDVLTDDGKIAVRDEKLSRLDQAGSGAVLMSRSFSTSADGSLVYYGVHINDVFAYFSIGQQAGEITASDFPTTQAELTAIIDYAKNLTDGHQRTINDGNALAVELKSSWVKADAVEDKSKYIIVTEEVPVYTHSTDTKWIWDGTTLETVELALVGFHVVGSAKDHPEMIWATFESLYNAPDDDYQYTNTSGETSTVSSFTADSDGQLLPNDSDWLFYTPTGAKSDANTEKVKLGSNEIDAVSGETISQSDTYRVFPWGDGGVSNNTEILSLNVNILGQLKDGDIRKNYALMGATWTKNGTIPEKMSDENIKGSVMLSNATMETYTQATTSPVNTTGCFGCHNLNGYDPSKDTHMNFLSHNYRVSWPTSSESTSDSDSE